MSLPAEIAQGASELSSPNNPIAWVMGTFGAAFLGLCRWAVKELGRKFDTLAQVTRDGTKEVRETNKSIASLVHRQKGLESAIQMEVLTRPNVPSFLREQLEDKMRRRERSEDTRDEPS